MVTAMPLRMTQRNACGTMVPRVCMGRTCGQGAMGFSLMEVLTVCVVMTILFAIAVPNVRQFVLSQKVSTAASDLFLAMTLARSEAIKRNADVAITPASGGWSNGWTITTGATTIQNQAAYSGITIAPQSGSASAITYKGTGRLSAAVSPLSVTTSSGNAARCISINISGLPQSAQGSC